MAEQENSEIGVALERPYPRLFRVGGNVHLEVFGFVAAQGRNGAPAIAAAVANVRSSFPIAEWLISTEL